MGETTFKIILAVFSLLFVAFIAAIIIFIREYGIKKRIHLKKLESVDLLHKKELLETQTEIQKETMAYIGREIHDNVGQKLTLSSLYLQQLIFENKTPEINKNIDEVNDIINESLIELRHLSKSLIDDTIKSKSISELIENECEKVRALKKYSISFESQLSILIKSYQTKSILLRIVQEFFQNSIKHSKCENLEITLSNLKEELKLVLKDDGEGFDIENIESSGIGLKNMKKRIELIQGDFDLKSDKNGTTLTLKLPV